MNTVLLSFLPCFWAWVTSTDPISQFPVSAIPANLTENAGVVVRLHETTFTVKNTTEATEKVRFVYTILNKNYANDAQLKIIYDNFQNVSSIKGTLYDKYGQELRKLKPKDIADAGGITSNMIDDVRVKMAWLQSENYPFTVSYEFESAFAGSLFYPTWQPQEKQHFAVEKASFKVVAPKGISVRYKAVNGAGNPVITSGNSTEFTWKIDNLPAIVKQPFQPSLSEITPVVYTAPNEFSVGTFSGNMSTWEGFGKWSNQLNYGRDKLSEITINQIKTLVSAERDELKKITILYRYLQNKTRYVSVQLGVGGWQTANAASVDSKGYGDCKALTNYMQALLKVAGIPSFYALVKAGENESPILTDFPSQQFNHVILCVPTKKDTVWLECTDNSGSWGYNGAFTGNRHALLITPEGGKLVRTPAYTAEKNRLERIAYAQFDSQGNLKARVTTIYTGLQQDDIRRVMDSEPETQKEWLNGQIRLSNFTIPENSFKAKDGFVPEVTQEMVLQVNKYASQSGKRLFLNPNLNNVLDVPLLKNAERNLPVVLKTAFYDSDKIIFQLPAGVFNAEYLPEPVKIKSIFGEYNASCLLENDQLIYTRSFTMGKGQFPAPSYKELSDFLKQIMLADKRQAVLIPKS